MMRGAEEGVDKKEAKIRRKPQRNWTAAEKRFIDWLGKLRQVEKASIDKGLVDPVDEIASDSGTDPNQCPPKVWGSKE